MNKRPFLVMFTCFVLGEIGVYMKEWWYIVVMAAGASALVAWYECTNGVDWTLLLLVSSFLLGAVFAQNAVRGRVLDDKCENGISNMVVDGRIVLIERRTTGYRIYLDEADYTSKQYAGHFKYRILLLVDSLETTSGDGVQMGLGQRVRCSGTLQLLSHARNPGGFDAYWYYRSRKVDYRLECDSIAVRSDNTSWLLGIKEQMRLVREQVAQRYQKLLDSVDAGFLEAIVLGEKADLDQDAKQAYQQAGIAHVIAISGLHIGFLGVGLFGFLRKIRLPYWLSALLAGGLIFSYGIFTGMSGSCRRAIIMLLVSFVGQVIGRAYDMLSAMSFAGILILMDAPMQLLDAGFLLSFSAIFGIGALYPVLEQVQLPLWLRGRDNKWVTRLWEQFLVSLSVQLATLPVIAWFYYELPLYGIWLNLIVIPLMSLLVPSALLGVLMSYLKLSLGKLFLTPAVLILHLYQRLSDVSNALPFAHFVTGQPLVWQLLVYACAIALILCGIHRKRYAWAFVCALLSGIILLLPAYLPGHLTITMLDVGQGDGLVVQTPKHQVYLIDGGSSSESNLYEYTYVPYLKSQGITEVAAIFVSHSDTDHISAIKDLLEQGYPIGRLIVPDTGEDDDKMLALIQAARQHGTTVVRISRGQCIKDTSGLLFYCLNPVKGFVSDDANEMSMTLSLQYEQFSMLFTGDLQGDAEQEVEQYIMEHGLGNYSVLKVAHHGSRNSSSDEFLAVVHASVSLISCGVNNRYGHPHVETVARLEESGAKIYRTDEIGAVELCVSDGKYCVVGFLWE